MTNIEYEAYVASRVRPYVTADYCAIAIPEEAGEVAGWFKKFVLRGNPTGTLTIDDLKGELGDVLFYVTAMAALYGWSLGDVMAFNKAKLDDRVARQFKQVV